MRIVRGWITKVLVTAILLTATIVAYGGAFSGWFLPKRLDRPVSLRNGSAKAQARGYGAFFIGRTHYGGGYRGGK